MQVVVAHRASGIIYRLVRQYPGCYILPANVCPIVPLTIILAGSVVKFVDISKDTWCLDEKETVGILKDNLSYRGVFFVHTYGCNYNPQSFFSSLKSISNEIIIVDDKCLCVPSVEGPSTVADMTLFSTGYAKYVDFGHGGFCFLKDGISLSQEYVDYSGFDIEALYKDCFKNRRKLQDVPNGWLDAEVSNEYGSGYFKDIKSAKCIIAQKKNCINSIYDVAFASFDRLGNDYNNWRYNILVKNKDIVLSNIFASGLFASSHYQPSSELFCDTIFSNSKWLYEHIINLFNDKYITEAQAIKMVGVLTSTNCSKSLIL